MNRLLPLAFVALVAACGGDGDSLPAVSTPAPAQGSGTPAAAQIDGANYLDAFAVGAVALTRVIDAAHVVGVVRHGTSRLDAPGAQDCWAMGALNWDDTVLDEYTRVVHPCASGSVELRSGAFSVTRAGTGLTDVVWRHPPGHVERAIGGNIALKQNADGSTTIAGSMSVLRGDLAIDEYTLVSVTAAPAAGGNPARAIAGSLRVHSQSFAPAWLTVAVSDFGAQVSVIAADGTHVVVTEVAGGTTPARRFEVFDAEGSAPVVTQTLTMDDPLVTTALARAHG
jgi:hypothetical protein